MESEGNGIMAAVVTVVTALIGWCVIYGINNHFYSRNKQRSDISEIIKKLENIQKVSLSFWIDTNHISTFADQQQLSIDFKAARVLLRKLETGKYDQLLQSLNAARKSLTNTPESVRDFSKMDKSLHIFQTTYETGNQHIQDIIHQLMQLEP